MSQKSSVPQAVSFVSRVLKGDTEYLREIVGDLEATVAPCKIQLDAPEAVQFVADRSILVGLIVNELVSNAGKYAYPDGSGGPIQVRAVLQPDRQSILISVRDEGVGLPADFNPETSKRLGTRMVNALSKQLGGEVTRLKAPIGTNFTLVIPSGGPRPPNELGPEQPTRRYADQVAQCRSAE